MSKCLPLPVAIAANNTKACAVSGCNLKRDRVASYCKAHSAARWMFGHPLGRTITPKEMQVETITIREFTRKYQGHRALAAGCKVVEDWLKLACLTPSRPAATAIRHLHDMGVEPMRVIEAAAALWLYSQNHPHAFADDQALTWAMGRHVLKLAAGTVKTSRNGSGRVYYNSRRTATEVSTVGATVRQMLVPLICNICTAIADTRQFAINTQEDMAATFTTTTTKEPR